MPNPAIRSFGTTLKVNTTVLVGNLVEITFDGTTTNEIDITNHGSTSGYKEFMGGLHDGGSLNVKAYYNSKDAGQAYLINNPGVTTPFEVGFTDGSKFTGSAIVSQFAAGAPLDSATDFSGKLKITGPLTFTPAT